MSTPGRELKCYWMRGLPACGKTAMAGRLMANTEGIICDPHKWFEENQEKFRHYKLTRAKRWAWSRCKIAAYQHITPIVMDMHVGINNISRKQLKSLEHQGYVVELVEPDSNDWEQIRALLLFNRQLNRLLLDQWAETLAKRSQFYRYTEIRTQMNNWQFDTLSAWRY